MSGDALRDAGREAGCPKAMVHGPCGGVAADATCELGDRRCPFVDRPTVPWAFVVGDGAPPASVPPLRLVVDLPDVPCDPDATRRAAGALAGRVDAVLAGDVGDARVQLPPSLRASLIAAEGVQPWMGLNCRDRNRVALESELHGLRAVGAGAHCITGDHHAIGHRAEAPSVFDFDSTALVALAARVGVPASVAENPVAPPVDRRAARLAEKHRAGATVCFVNHAGGAGPVADFVSACHDLGLVGAVRFVVCVPLVVSARGAAALHAFTGLAVPPGHLEAVAGATDPWREGVRRTVALASTILDLHGVHGVDLSIPTVPGDEAEILRAAVAAAGELHR